ncbi:hypothetical protein [Nocardioides mangrovi]|uniref:Bacterial SCP orthologue domain-containing protein n=1 Tax=Nocardioides mangrovi TaxID=2874580 RepID=A0ABS7UIP6_9ACTN|nr:hypothetical protein [Nocardioides mangrovi]MBZ5740913.1 hypothetical protein [Nocardioides mangrovi]
MEPLARDAELPPMVAAAIDRVTAHATGAWTEVTGTGEPVTARLEPGPGDTVVARARATTVCDVSPLLGLELMLAGAGWTTTHPPAGLDVLAAQRAGDELLASYAAPGVVTVTVTSAPLPA